MTQRKHRTPEQWEAIYQDWQSSGLSMPKFCAQIKIPPQSLSNYTKRRHPKEQVQPKVKAAGFVELGALPAASALDHPIEIVLDIGHTIQLRIRHSA